MTPNRESLRDSHHFQILPLHGDYLQLLRMAANPYFNAQRAFRAQGLAAMTFAGLYPKREAAQIAAYGIHGVVGNVIFMCMTVVRCALIEPYSPYSRPSRSCVAWALMLRSGHMQLLAQSASYYLSGSALAVSRTW